MSVMTTLIQWQKSLFLLLLSACSFATLAESCTTMPTSGGVYSVINRGSNLALDVNTSDSSGAPDVISYQYWGGRKPAVCLNQGE